MYYMWQAGRRQLDVDVCPRWLRKNSQKRFTASIKRRRPPLRPPGQKPRRACETKWKIT